MAKKIFGLDRRALFGLFFIAALLVSGALRHQIFRFGVEVWLNSKYPIEGGWDFSYNQILLERDRVIFLGTALRSKGGNLSVESEKIDLVARNLSGFKIDFALLCKNPLVVLDKTKKTHPFAIENFFGSSSHLKVDIEGGACRLVEKEGITDLYFSLASDETERSFGSLYLSSNEVQRKEGANLLVKLYQWPQESIAEMEMQDVDFRWFANVARFFVGHKEDEWKVGKGFIDGRLWVGVDSAGKITQTTALVHVNDFLALREKEGIAFSTEEVSWDFSYPGGKKLTERVDIWWQNSTLKSRIQGGRIGFEDPKSPYHFTLYDISGDVNFSSFKDSEIRLKGFLDQNGEVTPIVLGGNPSVVDKDTLDFDMKLLLQAESKYTTHINLSLSLAEEDRCIVKGRLKDLGIEQIGMLQQVVGFVYPEIKEFHVDKGIINCGLSLLINQGRVEKLLLENFVAENLEIGWATKDLLGFCSRLSGSMQLDFHTLPKFQFPAWEIHLENGNLLVGKEGISDINMQIFMCRDVFEPSWIKGTYQGVEVVAGIVGYYPEADVKLAMGLSGDRALSFVCEDFEGIEQFKEHQLRFSVDLRRQLGYWNVNGEIDLDVKGNFVDHAKFGCHLSDRVMRNQENFHLKNILASLSKGWFKGENISCESIRFINHPMKNPWSLEGMVSIEGAFDSKEIEFDLASQYLHFFSPEIEVHLNPAIDSEMIKTSEGKFYYHLKEKKFRGYFPLFHASLFEKMNQLTFNDMAASLYIDGNSLHLGEIQTESEGLELKGEVALDLGIQNGFDLKIQVNSVAGTVWQMGNFIRHIELLQGIEFPLDGRITGGERALFFHLNTGGEKPLLDWDTRLRLMHASYHINPSAVLHDLEMDLEYLSGEHLLSLANIHGKLASNYYEDGYVLNGRNIEVYGDSKIEKIVFDVRLENPVMDLVRIVGSFDETSREVSLDPEYTQFFGISPEIKQFRLDEKYAPTELAISSILPLEEISQYKRLLTDLGWIDFSGFYEDEDGGGGLNGNIGATLTLEKGLWEVHIDADRIFYEGKEIENVQVAFQKEGPEYRIQKCAIGPYHLMGVGRDEGEKFSLTHVSLSTAKSAFECGEGMLSLKEKRFLLPIEKGTVDISEWGEFSGVLDVKGEFGMNFGKNSGGKLFFGRIGLEGSGLGKEGFRLTTPTQINIEYSAERGVLLRDFSLLLKKGEESYFFEVPTFVYSMSEECLQGFRVKTILSEKAIDQVEKLSIFKEVGYTAFLPRNIDRYTTLFVDFEVTKGGVQIGGMLQEGVYAWRGNSYEINGLNFQYDKNHLNLHVEAPLFGKKFGCAVKIVPHGNFETTLEGFALGSHDLLKEEKERFYIQCALNTPEGLSIQKIEGNLFGLSFSFLPEGKMEEDYLLTFLGSMTIDAEKLLPICNQDMKDFIQELQLKKGYTLKGELTLVRGDLGNSFFEGYLQGKEFDLLGYQLKTFLGSIRFNKNCVNIADLRIVDDAVAAEMKEIKIYLDEKDTWKIQIPELQINDLRPSLLKKRYQANQRIKPFHIKNMVFQDVTGTLNNVSTFTGKGHLNFVNTFKQGHNLLDIPLEIISRLGLDMVLLVPIQGELEYVLKNGKVVFTKLKNSFSESKRSYFYLWNKTESYVDFHGNMHIDIRMKQYVLLKFTELFVLSINGSLETPRISLR